MDKVVFRNFAWRCLRAVNVRFLGASLDVAGTILYHLKTHGKYEHPMTKNPKKHFALYDVKIHKVTYTAKITVSRNADPDVIVECFAIDDVHSLENKSTRHETLPAFFALEEINPEVPILLVGIKAHLREANQQSLFPVELGPIYARYSGAMKYMECSFKEDFNVHEVIEEAVKCSLGFSILEFIDKDLYPVMDVSEDQVNDIGMWDVRLKPLNYLYPDSNSHIQHDILLVDALMAEPVPSRIKKLSPKNAFMYRALEFDRLQISYGLPLTRFVGCESPTPSCALWQFHTCSTDPTQIVHCRLFSVAESHENVLCPRCPANLRFFANDCKSISSFFVSARNQLEIRSLVIVNCTGTLEFSFLANLTGLEYLIIIYTDVDLATLTFPPHLQDTITHLVMNNCGITQATDVPSEIGKLVNLQILNLANNKFKTIPTTLGYLEQLHTLLIDEYNVLFPPPRVFERSVKELVNFLRAIEEDPVANKELKLIVVGQERVGKSTLVKAMKRNRWWFTKTKDSLKTEGVDISILPFKNFRFRVFDTAGDVEYLNTHSLFLSANTLHLVVFDLSRVIVGKRVRSADHLCRLELWLETIASRDPKSSVILVGTHADHTVANEEILKRNRNLLAEVLVKHCSRHEALHRSERSDECFICNPEKCPENLVCYSRKRSTGDTSSEEDSKTLHSTASLIPHVLGYFEVSSTERYPKSGSLFDFENNNIEKLKSLVASSFSNITKTTGTEQIPERWLSFRKNVTQELSLDNDLKEEPLMPLSEVHDIALELGIHEESVMAMLRFFHCQGTYLWYEDLPEMKDFVIVDPQWLSSQLCTLISHRLSDESIFDDGVLHLSTLSKVWGHISEDNQQHLLALFRSVGLCFSISDTAELFPYKLPVGWPDREMWPPVPKPGENQTSLLFKFSFVPPSFFPDLIVEVNKKNETFARNVKPLYYRFHIVYIRRDVSNDGEKDNASSTGDDSPVFHRVHFEHMPYNNSLTVTVRGPDPPSILPDILSMIEIVRRRRYPGITYTEKMLCPECVMNRVHPPGLFEYDDDKPCPRGHIVGSSHAILQGRYRPPDYGQTITPDIVEALEDHICPKLFVVLPINLESLSLKDRFVHSYIRDGYAVHLLCECPDQWHFVDFPGFRVGKPKEFFGKYGTRVCKALRFISKLSTPIRAAASLDPHCQAVAAVGAGAESASQELQSLLDSYLDKYPHLKPTLGSSKDDLQYLESSYGLQRSELSRFLEVKAERRGFGPLVCTYVRTVDKWLWLCEEHSEMYTVIPNNA